MADSAQPNVRKFLDLTTRHLPEDVLNDLNGFNGVIAHPTPYGAWLWVPDDPQTYADDDADSYRAGSEAGDDQDDDGSAAEILMVQLHARSLGLRLGPVRRRRRCRRRPAYLGLVTTALPCGGPTPQYHAPALPLSSLKERFLSRQYRRFL